MEWRGKERWKVGICTDVFSFEEKKEGTRVRVQVNKEVSGGLRDEN